MLRNALAKSAFFIALSVVCCIPLAGSLVSGQSQDELQPGQLLREGTRIDARPATCRFNGERLSVDIEGMDRPFLALENLAAQRVLEAVRDDPNDDFWLLNGTITEFRGSNYVLLERVRRSMPGQEN